MQLVLNGARLGKRQVFVLAAEAFAFFLLFLVDVGFVKLVAPLSVIGALSVPLCPMKCRGIWIKGILPALRTALETPSVFDQLAVSLLGIRGDCVHPVPSVHGSNYAGPSLRCFPVAHSDSLFL